VVTANGCQPIYTMQQPLDFAKKEEIIINGEKQLALLNS